MSDDLEKLMEILQRIVNEPGPWEAKRDRIWNSLDYSGRTTLLEFTSLFQGMENQR